MKGKISQRDFGLGYVTTRLMSVSTRAGTSRSAGTRRTGLDDEFDGAGDGEWYPHTNEEARGLLAGRPTRDEEDEEAPWLSSIDGGDEEDQDAMAALMKLRPAVSDSVGGSDDDDEEPLMGSDERVISAVEEQAVASAPSVLVCMSTISFQVNVTTRRRRASGA
eukprot:CAMPEP_0180517642 /NCGR_PEP_ID=MMETSP1036_2-20121128/54644_1 /TAXON_ID=632150 /ORGANISM="Azadinium spinosum, Strain 3D9" /LENGTH=163 /DNA_ID=CAMNT_0022529689 /DNA_START=13 /DNA_END=501 /DNA_ORIENTATION=-